MVEQFAVWYRSVTIFTGKVINLGLLLEPVAHPWSADLHHLVENLFLFHVELLEAPIHRIDCEDLTFLVWFARSLVNL